MNTEELVLNAFSAYITGRTLTVGQKLNEAELAAFVKKSAMQKVLPMTAEALIDTAAPCSENIALLKKEVIRQIVSQARRSEAFRRVYAELAAAGVRPVCVKGVGCRELYPEPERRLSGDEDILVRSEEAELCRKKLLELGFRQENEQGTSFDEAFVNSEDGCRVELHTALFSPDSPIFGGFNAFFEDIFEKAIPLVDNGVCLLAPCPEQHLLYITLHSFKHFIHSGTGIRQFCDIALFAKAHPESIGYTAEKCALVNADVFFNAALLTGVKYFGLDEMTAKNSPGYDGALDIAPLLEDIMSGSVYGADSVERQHSSSITLRSAESSGRGAASSVLAAVFPKAEKMKKKYSYVKEHPVLLPVAWAHRLITYAGSHTDSSAVVKIGQQRAELLKRYGVIK